MEYVDVRTYTHTHMYIFVYIYMAIISRSLYIYIYMRVYVLSLNPVKLYSKHRPKYYQVLVALRLAVLLEVIVTTVWGALGLWMEETAFRYGITLPSR